MNTSSENKIEKPKIIRAIKSGFNTIANKPYLMIPPILLDLFLWFGPAWRVDSFFKPILQRFSNSPSINGAEYSELVDNFQSIWTEFFTNLDLARSLRTFPIGVPSLITLKQPFQNPLGKSIVFNLESSFGVIGLWLIFLILGFFLGSLYFDNISKQIVDINSEKDHNIKSLLRAYLQIILMPIMILIILLIISIPTILIMSIVSLLSPAISQFLLIAIGFLLLWIILPLLFTPHGIFLYKQNLISAMMTSISVVKTSMSQTTWFILAAFVLIEGMNYLWTSPSADNWFLIIGIFGHAFVVSAVTAASFYYFLDATAYTQSLMNKKIMAVKNNVSKL
jgi:hypothetical protein